MVKLNVKMTPIKDDDPPDIFRAAKNNDANELVAALQSGQNLDMTESRLGMTPLHLACISHSSDFLTLALKFDHDPWIRDHNLRLAFDHAVAQNLTEIGRQMLKKLYPPGWNTIVPPQA